MSLFAFGLIWDVDPRCPEWAVGLTNMRQQGDQMPVITVRKGENSSCDVEFQSGLSVSGPACCIFGVPNIARYDITPDSVTVHVMKQADPEAVQLFLWGSAAGAVLHLRGILLLHGSTVRLPEGTAAVFCGHSGAGKSTTVAALGLEGLASVSDDISAVHFDAHGQAWVQPGLPRVKLWGHALRLLDKPNGPQIRKGIDKYYLDMSASDEPLPLKQLYELVVQQEGPLAISPIVGVGRISTLLTHTYRPTFIAALGMQGEHMVRIARLAPLLKMGRISRPQGESTLKALTDLVLRDCA